MGSIWNDKVESSLYYFKLCCVRLNHRFTIMTVYYSEYAISLVLISEMSRKLTRKKRSADIIFTRDPEHQDPDP